MKNIVFSLIASTLLIPSMVAQGDKYGETEEQQTLCKENLVVYRDFRDQKNYEAAYKPWQKACEICPPTVSQRLYSDGAKFFKAFIKTEKDETRKAVLVDSLMMMYDLRMEHFPSTSKKPNNKFEVLGLKGYDAARYKPEEKEENHEMFRQAIGVLGSESKASILSKYYVLKFELFKEAEGEERDALLQELLVEYLDVADHLQQGIDASEEGKERDRYVSAKQNVDEIFVLVAECEDMVPVLQDMVNKDPESVETKAKVLDLMNKKGCTDTDFFLQTAIAVCDNEQTPECLYSIGMSYAKKKENRKALEYLEQAADMCTDCGDKEMINLKAGQVASSMGQSKKARSYANKVLAINPGSGEAYLLIGDAIAGSASMCDDGALGSRSVYWLAVDYYNRAASKDASIADRARKKAGTYKGQFPSIEELFEYSLKEGADFTVTCWGESTKIRKRN
jgi:tetratricopeptide (TPR) repeat protein